ncbi:MAG TPA: GMC family oxidoreductase N-terminal domain-containing protein [Gemmatimonadaceae bacterium]|nr:GMC family oxidoreductase N-terminal domain-containing protein [Gemmatimonadaceae bacterium]
MPEPDLIIVGGGTAGCVLAERLTRSGRRRVLVVEAGGEPRSPFVKIPAGFARLFRGPLDWAFTSEPQTSVGGRRVFTPRGRMLGGCSNMNAMIHQWCHPADFDGWADAGAAGWSWADVAPTFTDQERWTGAGGAPARGDRGPLVASPNPNARPLSRLFVEAARNAGLRGGPDYNGGNDYVGAWMAQLAVLDGRRFSAYDAFLAPARARANLEVLTGAHATRVVIENGRATGVRVRRGNLTETIPARAGVIVCAGAFGSPHLLMHSGVGPAADLTRLGIAVVRDAPGVGANLQDHPVAGVLIRTRTTNTLKRAESLPNLLRYLLRKGGPLASNVAEAFAFARSGVTGDAAPDVELLFAPVEWRAEGLERPRAHAMTIAVIALAPRSRGSVRLRGADPLAASAIDFGMLTDPDGVDAKVLYAGVRLARRIAATAPLAAECVEEMEPGARATSDEAIHAALGERLQTIYHPAGTCRMGVDARAVCDPRLRVRGVDGLWVCDASVMPTVPCGHPHAVVTMLAARGAAMID